jgi:hypothetical protein
MAIRMKKWILPLGIGAMLAGVISFILSEEFPVRTCSRVVSFLSGNLAACGRVASPVPFYLGIALLIFGFGCLTLGAYIAHPKEEKPVLAPPLQS